MRVTEGLGEWTVFARIAGPFTSKLPADDREDWLDDTMLEMARVKAKYDKIGKPLTEAGLMKVASYEFKGYWGQAKVPALRGQLHALLQ